ncbi:MAG TPA: lytic transglycosylase, partial [Erwiniaceae bacterium]|nr:lytic transglycosylase [Erwiniaceae bacterium]
PHYIMVPKANVAQLRSSLASGDIAAVQPTRLAANSASTKSYTVRNGDTLSGIASRMGVSVKALQRANNLRGNTIKPGQTLTFGNSVAGSEL